MRLICPVTADPHDAPAPADVLPRGWYDATGFGERTSRYYVATRASYHTGADLNRYDRREREYPVFAAADGVVVYCGNPRGWGEGSVIVLHHQRLGICTRYAHVEPLVQQGDVVSAGQRIATIADYSPQGSAIGDHLHFDVATDVLAKRPLHWPRMNLRELLRVYFDPLEALWSEW